jgi:hypothetical protein
MCNLSRTRRRIVVVLEWTPMAIWLGLAIALLAR